MGEYGETAQADDIINGIFDTDQLDEWEEYEHKSELKEFLNNLQRPKTATGPIPDMQWAYGAQEPHVVHPV